MFQVKGKGLKLGNFDTLKYASFEYSWRVERDGEALPKEDRNLLGFAENMSDPLTTLLSAVKDASP